MSNKNLNNLTDLQLRDLLRDRGFPPIPVTETTRNVLIRKLENYNKRSRVQHARDAGTHSHPKIKTAPNNFHRATQSQSSYKMGLLEDNGVGQTELGKSKVPKCLDAMPKIYAPPPILASYSNEENSNFFESDFVRIKAASPNQYQRNNQQNSLSHIGVVNRLLSFRECIFQRKHETKELTKQPTSDMLEHTKKNLQGALGNCANNTNFEPKLKNCCVPYILLCTFVVFMAFISLMYIIISPNYDDIGEHNARFLLCNEEKLLTSSNMPNIPNCIHPSQKNQVFDFMKGLVKMFRSRENVYYCNRNKKTIEISSTEILTSLHIDGKRIGPSDFSTLLPSAEYLIRSNPQWKITAIKTNKQQQHSVPNAVGEMIFFLERQSLSVVCHVYNKIKKCFVIVGIGALIAFVSLLIYFGYRYLEARREQKNRIVNQFITDIVNELKHFASTSKATDTQGVIVNHLRDKLIPLVERKRLIKEWNKALKILESYDSRIQFGLTVHNGEEFSTIKWIGYANGPSHDQLPKKWQSPAFDNSNKITNPPTPCLKIRHMFDPSEIENPYLKQIIEEAIFEKVGKNCRILDIQIDTNTCCVYMRCASEIDAGMVHNELNGWWFDKRLISIKFLRLQRYMNRFPNTVKANQI